MSSRRSVYLTHFKTRFEFGPFWYRWWLLLTTDGQWHLTGIGEPCVIYPDKERPDAK